MKTLLIDADIVYWKAIAAPTFRGETRIEADDLPFIYCAMSIDNKIADIRMNVKHMDVKFYMTATDKSCFRYELAKTRPYKAKRAKEKPRHYAAARSYLIDEYGAEEQFGQEADDALGIMQTKLGDEAIIASTDKDLDQIVGWHYNFDKLTRYYINEAQALHNFYIQVLAGDLATDNIEGIFGVGVAKAKKILEGCETDDEYYERCLTAYEGDLEKMLEMGRLVKIRTKEGEVWRDEEK